MGATPAKPQSGFTAHIEGRGVQQVSGVDYVKVDDQEMHVKMPDGDIQIHAVHIVVCTASSATSPTSLSIPTWWWSVVRKTPVVWTPAQAIREGLESSYSAVLNAETADRASSMVAATS